MSVFVQNRQIRLGAALEARLQAVRDRLSDKEQSVASFLQNDPQGFVSLSISALADPCGVSETVIIRLCRKLGYEGFHQCKVDIAQSLTEEAPSLRRFRDVHRCTLIYA